ncbi:MAG: hypothetical protein NVSMB65_08020 [Chloroflexota bacterium]
MVQAQTRTHMQSGTPTRLGVELVTMGDTRGVERSVGAVGLAAIGLIHLLDAPGKWHESPSMFWLYLALIAGCLGGATMLLRRHSRLGWLAAVLLSTMPFAGYVLSRSTGLPGATGDIGNWTEPLGLASLFVEACTCALGVSMLVQAGRPTSGHAGE